MIRSKEIDFSLEVPRRLTRLRSSLRRRMAHPPGAYDAEATDPALLRANSELKEYTAHGFTYPRLRVFYRPRPKIEELPQDPAPLPLLVFIHGLGGSVAQFHPLLTSLSNNASCLAVDLPGCGRSAFAPQDWDAYSTDALAELLEVVIEDYRDKENGQGVIFIGHSMGTVLAARLANQGSPHVTEVASHVMGLVGICPLSGMSQKEVSGFRNLLRIPTWLVDILRWWDQIGGPHSASVTRFVGPDADLSTRQLQARYNKQSKTAVFRRMCWGMLPTSFDGDKPEGGLFGEPTWAGLNVPIFLIGAENDKITPKAHIEKICQLLQSDKESIVTHASNSSETIGESAAPVALTKKPSEHLPQSIDAITESDFERRKPSANSEESFEDPSTPRDPADAPAAIPPQPLHPEMVVKTKILPSPATHACLYSTTTVRTLSGLVCDFLVENITGRLDFGWQLQHLNREGKWEVKNLEKWKAVQPVSDPIHGIFRAMKTLREVDDEHSPKRFSAKWSYLIKDIIDISKDNPAYDPLGLERKGIKYHKFPTVSKKPPNDAEVAGFIELVDRVREEQKIRAKENGWEEYAIGVHCHYGFNRTGYFIVCYLVERCGFDVQQAINLFKEARPNGIRHSHFLDRLSVRYSGLGN